MNFRRLIFVIVLLVASAFAQTKEEAKLATVHGTVVDLGTSQPLAKVVVKLSPMHWTGEEDPSIRSTTDQNGEYEFKSVPAGQYYVTADKTGYLSGSYGKGKGNRVHGYPIGIAEGSNLSGIDIKLERGGIISGRILNEEGEPLSNVHVFAMRNAYINNQKKLMPLTRAETDDHGEYRLHDLRPGTYYVFCALENRYGPNAEATDSKHAYPAVYYPGVAAVHAAMPIQISSGSEGVANFSVSPTAAFTVRGKVIGADDDVDVSVMLQPRSPGLWGMPQGGAQVHNGTFELKRVLPGTYTLVAFSNKDNKQKTSTAKVTVEDSDVNNVEIRLDNPLIEIHGTVQLLGDSKPELSGTGVSLSSSFVQQADEEVPWFGGDTYGQVKKDGSFVVTGSSTPGVKYVTFGGMHLQDWYLKSVFWGSRDVTDSGFVPASGGTLQLVISQYSATVEGLVLDKDGKPFPGAMVVTVPEEKKRVRHDGWKFITSDQRGYFQLTGLPPGNYKVLAIEDTEQYPPFDQEFLKPLLSKALDLTAEEKGRYNVKVTVIPAEPAK